MLWNIGSISPRENFTKIQKMLGNQKKKEFNRIQRQLNRCDEEIAKTDQLIKTLERTKQRYVDTKKNFQAQMDKLKQS